MRQGTQPGARPGWPLKSEHFRELANWLCLSKGLENTSGFSHSAGIKLSFPLPLADSHHNTAFINTAMPAPIQVCGCFIDPSPLGKTQRNSTALHSNPIKHKEHNSTKLNIQLRTSFARQRGSTPRENLALSLITIGTKQTNLSKGNNLGTEIQISNKSCQSEG